MISRFRSYVNLKYEQNALDKIKTIALIDPKYEISDDSWQGYPTARAIENLLDHMYTLGTEPLTIETIHKANGSDLLLDRLEAFLGRDPNVPGSVNNQTSELIRQALHLEKKVIEEIREVYDLTIDIALREIRLWLLDEKDCKITSGYFDTLLISQYSQTGIILKHVTSPTPFVAASDDKELGCLALIAADAFNLQEVVVAKLWAVSNSFNLGEQCLKSLQDFREQLKTFLKQI